VELIFFYTEDGDNMFFRNGGLELPPNFTALELAAPLRVPIYTMFS
jgi:hypothetical protein